ncbi:MAG: AsmA family protein, partial [Proteobacteria bacterium]|nr:AsmA family protein [Pseudomonadota bacterium]
MQKPNASAKKIAFFIFLFTLMILLIVPFFLDYSKFKPQFQTMIAKSFNANLDFDSARLQLLPKFGVSIRNLKIENTDPVFDRVTFLKVEKVLITTNLLSLLQGQIRGSAIIETPQIHVLKKGSLTNLAALPKATATNSDNHAKSASSNPDIKPDSSLPTPNSSQPATDRAISHTKETIELESIEIRGAMISYRDENQTQEENSKNTEHSNSTFDAKNLNVFISNLGFNRPIEIKANALMDYINGDIQING